MTHQWKDSGVRADMRQSTSKNQRMAIQPRDHQYRPGRIAKFAGQTFAKELQTADLRIAVANREPCLDETSMERFRHSRRRAFPAARCQSESVAESLVLFPAPHGVELLERIPCAENTA